MGLGVSQPEPVKPTENAFKPKPGKGEVASLQSRKQQQEEEIAKAKASRDALLKADEAARQQAEEERKRLKK